jgi:hypothetical protein
MRSLLDIVSENQELFSRVAVHPSTNFPGRTQENILLQILRKKPEPDVEAAFDDGRKTFAALGPAPGEGQLQNVNGGDHGAAPAIVGDGVLAALEARWKTASNFTEHMIQQIAEDDPYYTAEEREMGVENVRTGLRRVFEDYEEDEGDDEDDDDEDDEEGGQQQRQPSQNGTAGSSFSGLVAPGGGDDDLVMLDRPPPAVSPNAASLPRHGSTSRPAGGGTGADESEEGLPLENMLRLATRGDLLAG